MNDQYQLPHDKLRVEFAFTSAWRKWERGSSYAWMQRVATGAVKDLDVIHIITELDKNKRDPYVPFYWDAHAPGGPTIYSVDNSELDWSDSTELESQAKGLSNPHIPATAWADLAEAFLENLSRD